MNAEEHIRAVELDEAFAGAQDTFAVGDHIKNAMRAPESEQESRARRTAREGSRRGEESRPRKRAASARHERSAQTVCRGVQGQEEFLRICETRITRKCHLLRDSEF
jgi:hypothetical protein